MNFSYVWLSHLSQYNYVHFVHFQPEQNNFRLNVNKLDTMWKTNQQTQIFC